MKKITLFFFAGISLIFPFLVFAKPLLPVEKIPSGVPIEILCQIEKLYSDKQDERINAVENLGNMGSKAFTAFSFIKAFFDDELLPIGEDIEFKQNAIIALEKININEALLVIRNAVKNKNKQPTKGESVYKNPVSNYGWELRQFAVNELCRLNDTLAVDILKEAASDININVRESAIKALETIKPKKTEYSVINANKNSNSVELLKELVNDKDFKIRIEALDSLSCLDTSCIEIYKNALNDKNFRVKLTAAKIYERFDTKESIVCYEDIIKNGIENSVKVNAIKEINKFKTKEVQKKLILRISNESDYPLLYELINAVGEYDDAETAEYLINKYKNFDKNSRLVNVFNGVFQIISKMKNSGATQLLLDNLKTDDRELKLNSVEALGKMGCGEALNELIRFYKNTGDVMLSRKAAGAIAKIKFPEKPAYIAEFLNDKDMDIKIEGLKGILPNDETKPIELMMNIFKSEKDDRINSLYDNERKEKEVRNIFIKLITKNEAGPVGILVKLLKSSNSGIRRNSAIILEKIGWHPANDEELAYYHMAFHNIYTCSKLPEKSRKIIMDEACDSFSPLRISAINALAYFEDSGAAELLSKFLNEQNKEIALVVVSVISKKKNNKTFGALLNYLKNGRYFNVKIDAALILSNFGDISAIEPLKAFLTEHYYSNDYDDAQKLSAIKRNLSKLMAYDKKSLGLIAEKLRSGKWGEIDSALEILNEIKCDDFKNEIVNLLSADYFMSRKAAELLRKIDWQPQTDTEEVYYLFATGNFDKLRQAPSHYAEILASQLDRNDNMINKIYTIECLTKLKVPKTIKSLDLFIGKQEKNYLKQACVTAIGKIGGTEAVEVLIKYIYDKELGKYAIEYVAESKDDRAVKPLIAMLNNSQLNFRTQAARSLSNFHGRVVTEALIKALNDSDGFVRSFALESLLKMNDNSCTEFFPQLIRGKNWLEYCNYVKLLKKFGWKPSCEDEKAKYYLAVLKVTDDERRAIGLAYNNYMNLMNEKNNKLKEMFVGIETAEAEAVKELSNLKDDVAVGMLLSVLETPKADTPEKKALEFFNNRTESSSRFKQKVVNILSEIKTNRSNEGLVIAAQSENTEVRNIAAGAIKRTIAEISGTCENSISGIKSIDFKPFFKRLMTEDENERKQILKQLEDFKWQPATDEEKIICLFAKNDINGLKEIKESALKYLLNEVKNIDSQVRERLLTTIFKLSPPNAVEIMKTFFYSDKLSLKIIAVRELCLIGEQSMLKQIVEAAFLKNSYAQEFTNAIIELRPKNIEKFIVTLLFVNERSIAANASKCLEKMGWKPETDIEKTFYYLSSSDYNNLDKMVPTSLRILSAEINDEFSPVRLRAAMAFEKMKNLDTEAIEVLIANVNDSDYLLRDQIISTLGYINNSEARDCLMKLASEYGSSSQEKAVEALGEARATCSVGLLINLLNHDYWRIREEAAESLGKIADKKARVDLLKLLKDDDEEVSKAARKAIGQIDAVELKSVNSAEIRLNDEKTAQKLQNDTLQIEFLLPVMKNADLKKRKKAADDLEKLKWIPKNDTEKIYYFFAQKDFDNIVKINNDTAAEILINEAKKADDYFCRESAWRVLGKLKCQKAREFLFNFINTGHNFSEFYMFLGIFMENINEDEIKKIIAIFEKEEYLDKKRKIIEMLYNRLNGDIFALLKNTAFNTDNTIRYYSADGLKNYNETEGVEILKKLIRNDPELIIRLTAAQSLFKISADYLIEFIPEFLKSKNTDFILTALKIIDKFNRFEYTSELPEFIVNESEAIRYKASKILEKFKWRPLNDFQDAYYCFAKNATAEINLLSDESVKILIGEVRKENSKIRYDVMKFLSFSDNKRVTETFIELARSSDDNLKVMAVEILGVLKEKNAVSVLKGILSQNDAKTLNYVKGLAEIFEFPKKNESEFIFRSGVICRLRAAAIESLYKITGSYYGNIPAKDKKPPQEHYRIHKLKLK